MALGKGLESLIPKKSGPVKLKKKKKTADSSSKAVNIEPSAEQTDFNSLDNSDNQVKTASPGSYITPKQTGGRVAGTGSAQDFSKAKSSSFRQPPEAGYYDSFSPKRTGESIFWIEVEKIEPNPFQPRREFSEESLRDLANSIREHGLIQPILVAKREIETSAGLEIRYQLISGERRWKAARLAGLSQIPAIIRRGMPDDRVKLELALIENVQREDLNPIERAWAYRRLIDEFNLTQREVAEKVGKSRESVANTVRLLSLPKEIQDSLARGEISEGHTRAILMIGSDPAQQIEVFRTISSRRLSVRESEQYVRDLQGRKTTPYMRLARYTANIDPESRELQNKLQDILGTKVYVIRRGIKGKGKIIVEFYSEEELQSVLKKIMGGRMV